MFLTASTVILLVTLYVCVSFAAFMRVSLRVRLALVAFFFLIGQKYTIYWLVAGNFFNPIADRTLLVTCECLFNILLVLLPLLVIKDILYWATRLASLSGVRLPYSFSSDKAKWILLGFAIFGAVYGTHAALRVPEVKRLEVKIANLPTAFEGYRFVLMADLHVGRLMNAEWLNETIERAMALKPQAVLLSGDIVEGRLSDNPRAFEPYKKLAASDGVYAVTGNHEWHYGADEWAKYFASLGWQVLDGRFVTIKKGNDALILAGLTDLSATRWGIKNDIDDVLDSAPNVPVILLSHQPKTALEVTRADLQLSGHTHGGLYTFFAPIVSRANGGYVHGLYQVNERLQLYVTPGTGLWTGMSLRLGVPSEITEVTLKRR